MAMRNLCGKRIKLARINQELAQVELCAALSVDYEIEMSQNTLSNIERGERIIRDTELAAIAEVLNISPTWFLYGDNQPKFTDNPLKST